MAKLSMSTPAVTVLLPIHGGICNPLHCIYTNSILTVQLNNDTGKTEKKLNLLTHKLMHYPSMYSVRELVIIKFQINLKCCDLRSTWVSHVCTVAYVV